LPGDLAAHGRQQHPGLAADVARPVRHYIQHTAPAPSRQQQQATTVTIGHPACRSPHTPVSPHRWHNGPPRSAAATSTPRSRTHGDKLKALNAKRTYCTRTRPGSGRPSAAASGGHIM
jgi:hypothetical protein